MGAALLDTVGPGDRVAIRGPNSIHWAVASFGVLFAGGAVVPLNTRYTKREAADIIGRAGCRAVFAERAFLGRRLAADAARPPAEHACRWNGSGR